MPHLRVPIRRAPLAGVLLACLVAGALRPARAQSDEKGRSAPGLLIAPLAGQFIPVLPVTFLLADSVTPPGLPDELRARNAWADSLLGEALQLRGPEVSWVLPPELRRTARRAPGTVTDPDRMGQALLRNDRMTRAPDPLFSYLRSLTAMTNSRTILVPAAVRFLPAAQGARVEVTLVLVDARNGAIVWRSHPTGTGATAAAALSAAIAHVLPDAH